MDLEKMKKMLPYIQQTRPDVLTISGPDSQGNYTVDPNLPDQEEIQGLITEFLAIPESSVPAEVTRRQLKLALHQLDMLTGVEAFLSSMPEENAKAEAYIWWNDSQTFERTHTVLISLSSAMGMTSAEVDSVFTYAGNL